MSAVAGFGQHIKEVGSCHTGRQAASRTAIVASPSPATCSPRVITLSQIDSLKDLAEAMSSSTPNAVEDTSSPGQQGTGIQVILEVDLNGRTLAAPVLSSPLLIPPGIKIRLSNGSLHMPEDMYVLVGPGAELEAVRVEFRGSGKHWKGLITVEGEGASAALHQCAITGVTGGSPSHLAHGVLVAKGGRAALQNCVVQQATSRGIWVQGEGSTVTAASTMVQHCGGAGFAAADSGKLVAERCIAHSNTQFGFVGEHSGMLEAGAGCRAELNGLTGFLAYSGQLVAREGCYAGWNKGDGYWAYGSGGRLHAGAGCIAEHNGGCGFVTSDSAQILTGPECIAEHNGNAGYSAGTHGQLKAGAGSVAAHNQGTGFLVTWSGHLHAAMGCSAMHNVEAGFRVQYSNAKLTAEAGCTAEGNGRSPDDDWVQGSASGLLVRQ
jgi:hypothetical protein